MTIGNINGINLQTAAFGMEQHREKQQKQSSFDDMLGGNRNTGTAGSADMGVLISLSVTKEQIAGMKKVRTDLEGKLRTVETDEAKESLQEKIDNLTEDIYEKVKETQDTISDNQKAEQDKADKTEEEKEDETDDGSEEEQGE